MSATRAFEQALRAEDQDKGHGEGGDDLGQCWREQDRDHAVADADQQRRDNGAGKAAETTDDDDYEGQQQRACPIR